MRIVRVDVRQQRAHHGRHARTQILGGQTVEVRHRLVDVLDAVAHRELVDDLLRVLLEVDLPRLVALRRRQPHHADILLAQIVEEILVQARVLHVVRGDLLLALDLDADVQPDRAADGRLVRALLQIVPHVHFARQRAHLDDRLAEEVVRLARQLLAQLRLQVVVLVPHAHLDAIGRVVALAAWACVFVSGLFQSLSSYRSQYLQVEFLVPHRVQLLRHGARAFLHLAHLHGHVRIAGAALVLSDQALRADHCKRTSHAHTHTNASKEIETHHTHTHNHTETHGIFFCLGFRSGRRGEREDNRLVMVGWGRKAQIIWDPLRFALCLTGIVSVYVVGVKCVCMCEVYVCRRVSMHKRV